MNKTIKKIVAVSMATVMLGVTATAAVNAATLADYPSPFVANGAFVGKIVIGEKSAAVDTLGSMDIAASLQRASSTSVDTTTGGSTATAEDGYHFEENDVLVLGGTLSSVGTSTLDDSDLPDMLASGTIEADDGTDYDYDVEIDVSGSVGVVSADITADLEDEGLADPVVYFDMNNGEFYTTTIDFTDTWDATDFVDSEAIELFGRAYTFDPDNTVTDDVLTLFGSDTTLIVAKGESKTIEYNDKEYTIEVLGGNSDDSNAIVRVGSETKTVEEGDSRTLGGLPIYVKDVFISNIGGEDVSVQLFIGSNKIELDSVDGTVTKNGVELDGVEFTLASTNDDSWDDVSSWTFKVTPSDMEDEVDYILPGESYTDPVFGAFKFEFVGSEDLKADKEEILFTRTGSAVNIEFTTRGASEPVQVTLLEDDAVYEDLWAGADLTDLSEDKIFFYNDDADEDKAATHVLQVQTVKHGDNLSDEDFEVVVKDLSFDKTYTLTSDDKTLSSDVALYALAGSTADNITFVTTAGDNSTVLTTVDVLYTEAGAKIDLTDTGFASYVISEDIDADADTATAQTDLTVTPTWQAADDEYDLAFSGETALDDDNDDVKFYLTEFGTYVEEDDDEQSYVNVYVPATEVSYDMFLLPVESTVTVTSTTGGSAVALNPISVGMAIQDSEATLGNKPYIVVGGPCANTVAAELMGNPVDCAAGFSEGKAIIKLYSDKNALLVAGYSGKDTQGASRVVANYDDYAFSGTELEVITTNLNSLSVNKVN